MKRKSIKKTLVAITVMALAFTGMPEGLLSSAAMASAVATVASGSCGENLTWTLDEEGALVISGRGKMEDYSSGATVKPWNNIRNDIKTVQIDEGVTSIGGHAFEDCINLNNITIPKSVSNIIASALDGCISLKEIVVAQENCTYRSVDGVLYDKNIKKLVRYGSGRETLEFHIPGSVTDIGAYAFNSCSNLTDITIPNSVTGIGAYAFNYCNNLTDITIPDGVTDIGAYAFNCCNNLTDITIPDSVASIGNGIFSNCSRLIRIILPKSVTSIESYEFNGCSSLRDIIIAEENPEYQSIDGVLYNKNLDTLIRYGSGRHSSNFHIPDGVTTIEAYAFSGCNNLTEITIPNSVTTIEAYAFVGCNNLTEITIPNSVTTIQSHAFASCRNLTNVTIPNSVTNIGESALSYCGSLKNIEVAKDNMTYQSVNGVLYDKKLKTLICYGGGREETSFSIPDSVATIGNYAFSGCNNLKSIAIPNSVTNIQEKGLEECSSLKNIDVSEGNDKYRSIDGILYDKCASTLVRYCNGREVSDFSIPQGVTTIGKGAFIGCKNLSTLIMPDSVTKIEGFAFGWCNNLRKIQISKSIKTIEEFAFSFCDGLRSISIPNSVTKINRVAFIACFNLRSIRIPESVMAISAFSFTDCPPDLTIYGVKGSYAETYAKNTAIHFKDISEYTEEPDETPTPSPGNEDTPPSNSEENDTTPSPDGSDSKPPTPSTGNGNTNPSNPGDKDDTSSPEDNGSKPPTPSPSPSSGNSGVTPAKPDPEPGDTLPPISREEREKNEWQLNKKVQSGWKGNSLSVNWSKVPKASGYDLYAAACSTDYDQITVSVNGQNKTAAKITKIAGKRISKKATYKVIVRAYRLVNGRKQYIGTSADMHIAGSKNKKYTNAKSLKLPKKKISLKKKKKATLASRIVKQHPGKKLLSTAHGPRLRYTSSDNSVATVSKIGVLHAKKKGTCVICVRALNGISKQIKVTVK